MLYLISLFNMLAYLSLSLLSVLLVATILGGGGGSAESTDV